MRIASKWKDYIVLSTGDGEKIEKWGDVILTRPDPQIIWPKYNREIWKTAHGTYKRSSKGGGEWSYSQNVPSKWKIRYSDLTFWVETMGFKHTGLFPEQAVNWDYMQDKIRQAQRPVQVLNLFAYTGGATVACAAAGASVCHVDAAKGMVEKAKNNLTLSGLKDKPVRFIVDDVVKFVQREIRRGNTYEGIVMDPPSYGRGPKGEIWKLEDELYGLVELCSQVLSAKPLFFMLNSYTTGLSATVMKNILDLVLSKRFKGSSDAYELGLPVHDSVIILPCGNTACWEERL
ncbi:MAG TPA: SAM-dependent methyltransferase [Clostridiales bacterium]|nr:SAM-dependent methyltransferase [Clostridiales bacterium]